MDHESLENGTEGVALSVPVLRPHSIRRIILIGTWLVFAPPALYSVAMMIVSLFQARPDMRDLAEFLFFAGTAVISMSALYFSARGFFSRQTIPQTKTSE